METLQHTPPETITVIDNQEILNYELDQPQPMDRLQTLAGEAPDVRAFEQEAIAPDENYTFPEPPDTITDAGAQMGPVMQWRLSQVGCHLDQVYETVANDEQARQWLRLKLEVAAGKQAGLTFDILDDVMALEAEADAFLKSVDGSTVYSDV